MVCHIYLSGDFTNGNLYLAYFMQLAAESNKSERKFQKYVKLHEAVPHFSYKRTGITMYLTQQTGEWLKDALIMLDKYIGGELDELHEPIKIISHGGSKQLLLILALSIERSFGDGYLTELDYILRANFVDSAKELQKLGYPRPGLKGICSEFNIPLSVPQTAVGNASAIKQLCTRKRRMILEGIQRVTIQDLLHKAWDRMPLSLANVAMIAQKVSFEELLEQLYNHSEVTSALKPDVVTRVAKFYKNREDLRQSNQWLPDERSLWRSQPTAKLTEWMGSPYGR